MTRRRKTRPCLFDEGPMGQNITRPELTMSCCFSGLIEPPPARLPVGTWLNPRTMVSGTRDLWLGAFDTRLHL